MRWFVFTLVALSFLSGCEQMNEAVVRSWYRDRRLGSTVNDQISEGYRRRMKLPPPPPGGVAPAHLDEG